MKIEDAVKNSKILYSYNEINNGISNIADACNEHFKKIKNNVTLLPVMKGAFLLQDTLSLNFYLILT